MILKLQWYTRQVALELLSYVLCFTTALIIAPSVVKIWHFMNVGYAMWPGHNWPKLVTEAYTFQMLWELSLEPLVKWLPLTVVGDALLRRFVYRLYD